MKYGQMNKMRCDDKNLKNALKRLQNAKFGKSS